MFLGTIVNVIYCRRALAISPNSPVLMCHVAVVQVNSSTPISLALLSSKDEMHNHLLFQHATNNTQAALETLTSALKISPKYVLPKIAYRR